MGIQCCGLSEIAVYRSTPSKWPWQTMINHSFNQTLVNQSTSFCQASCCSKDLDLPGEGALSWGRPLGPGQTDWIDHAGLFLGMPHYKRSSWSVCLYIYRICMNMQYSNNPHESGNIFEHSIAFYRILSHSIAFYRILSTSGLFYINVWVCWHLSPRCFKNGFMRPSHEKTQHCRTYLLWSLEHRSKVKPFGY